MSYHILIPDRSDLPLSVEEEVVQGLAHFTAMGAKHASEIPDELWGSADALLLWHDVHLNAATVQLLARCRVIVRIGVGFDNVDLEATGAAGIQVCNVPDYGTEDVADHSLALLLSLARGLFQYQRAARRGEWSWQTGASLRRLSGGTLGIIGLGRIGIATARRAAALGMKIVFYDPYVRDGLDKALGYERKETLAELLPSCDVVSLHVPLTKETCGMVGATFLAQMKAGSLLINTCRGGLMDLDALHAALLSNQLRGAGLDVLPEEPPQDGHPLINAWKREDEWLDGRLIVTPHAAFFNQESYAEMRRKGTQEALRVLKGEKARNCVNSLFLRETPKLVALGDEPLITGEAANSGAGADYASR